MSLLTFSYQHKCQNCTSDKWLTCRPVLIYFIYIDKLTLFLLKSYLALEHQSKNYNFIKCQILDYRVLNMFLSAKYFNQYFENIPKIGTIFEITSIYIYCAWKYFNELWNIS